MSKNAVLFNIRLVHLSTFITNIIRQTNSLNARSHWQQLSELQLHHTCTVFSRRNITPSIFLAMWISSKPLCLGKFSSDISCRETNRVNIHALTKISVSWTELIQDFPFKGFRISYHLLFYTEMLFRIRYFVRLEDN